VSPLFEKLVKVISKETGTNENNIFQHSELVADLDMDSLDMMEVLLALESEFKVSIPDSEVVDIETVGELEMYLSRLLKNK
jgi:acyl carrier protein